MGHGEDMKGQMSATVATLLMLVVTVAFAIIAYGSITGIIGTTGELCALEEVVKVHRDVWVEKTSPAFMVWNETGETSRLNAYVPGSADKVDYVEILNETENFVELRLSQAIDEVVCEQQNWECIEWEERTSKALFPNAEYVECSIIGENEKVSIVAHNGSMFASAFTRGEIVECPKIATEDVVTNVCVKEGLNCKYVDKGNTSGTGWGQYYRYPTGLVCEQERPI